MSGDPAADKVKPAPRKRSDVPHTLPGGEIVAYLPLQVALFFNVCFSPVWFLASLVAQIYKFSKAVPYQAFILLCVTVVAGVLEAIRMYLGYEGNLREKVPRLVTFWFLNILQIVLVAGVVGAGQYVVYLVPMEAAVSAILLLFLVSQLVLAFWAIRRMIQAQAVKFHLTQFGSVAEESALLNPVTARTKLD